MVKMSQKLVCRLCLAANTRLFAIANTSLQAVYMNLTNIDFDTTEKPKLACYLCLNQLRKCQVFAQRAIRADELLTRMLPSGSEITPMSVAAVDRDLHKLSATLTMARIEAYGLICCQMVPEIKEEMADVPCQEEEMQSHEEGVPPAKKPKLHCYSVEDLTTIQEDVSEKSIENTALETKEKGISKTNEQEEINSNEKRVTENIRKRKKSVHNLKKLNKSFICNDCGKTFNKESLLADHIKNHTAMKAKVYFNCNLCPFQDITRDSLKKHISSHNKRRHSGDNRISQIGKDDLKSLNPYECKVCGFSCTGKVKLQTHLRTHTGEKPFKCKECGFSCSRKDNLKSHLRTHTGEKPFECNVCGFRFSRKHSLQTHLSTHPGEKPYECKVCGFRCRLKCNLQRHLRTHTGEKPYECKLCGSRFGQSSGLRTHLRTHTGEKPFECAVCGHRCGQKYYLQRHLKTHSGEKPFECDVCGFRCRQKFGLQVHLRTHTGEKPYECKICGFRCNQTSSIRTHLDTHWREVR